MATNDVLTAEMTGTRSELLALVLKTTALTVLTLGVYSFWARTRIRRWLWSSLHLGGMPFEYAGRPGEKLMGFVIAAVIVAIYLGVVVMLLVFASLNLTGDALTGTFVAFGLLLPVYWFSVYRGQRYLLNHTRWRGIAFSMVPGAWGYALTAMAWTAATALSLGLLLPVRTQRLWAYRAERTYFGDHRLSFATRARDLYPAFTPVLVAAVATAVFVFLLYLGYDLASLGLALSIPTMFFFWTRWRVRAFSLLASGLRAEGDVRIRIDLSTWQVIAVHILGWVLTGLLLGALLFGLLIATGVFAAGATAGIDLEVVTQASPYLLAAAGLLFYLTFFVLRGALRIAMVSFPLFRHGANTMSVQNPAGLSRVRLGESAHMADADGFANLFDMGSGI